MKRSEKGPHSGPRGNVEEPKILAPEVKERVDEFWELVANLAKLQSGGPSVFVENKYLIDVGERGIQLAVEALLDVGKNLVIDMGLKPVKDHRELGKRLREKRVLNKEQSEVLEKAVAFREALVHGYARPVPEAYVYIHPREIYTALETLRKGMAGVMKALQVHMEKQEIR